MQKNNIKNIIIIFIVVLALELIVFNFNSYRIFSSKYSTRFEGESLEYLESDEGTTLIKVSNVNEEIKTVHIEIENYEHIQYQFLYTDETTAGFADTPTKMYIGLLENSKYIPTYLSRR